MQSLKLASIALVTLTTLLSACELNSPKPIESATAKTENKVMVNDIWVLEIIKNSKLIPKNAIERPRLEVHLADMRIVGTDGCNNYVADIQQIDEEKINFGPLATTRKFCAEMTVADSFAQQMSQVHTYQLNNLKLYLFDSLGNEILSFQKID